MREAIVRLVKDGARAITAGAGDAAVELLRVDPGTFLLGSPLTEQGHRDSEGPARRVRLSQPFYLGRYPVTQRQYVAVTKRTPAKPAGPEVAIDQLTYPDALAFCAALSKLAGVAVTLPTEAQWEYACRAGTTTRFWSGDTEADLARVGWYRENADHHAMEVGRKPPNPWGFYDLHGNVCELCRDVLPPYDSIPATDPVGAISDQHGMMRGGAWMHPADYCRSASRLMSGDRFGGAGLRIAVEV